MKTVAKVVNENLAIVEIEDDRYFVEKLLDSVNYGIYDSFDGECLTWGSKNRMFDECYQMNKKWRTK